MKRILLFVVLVLTIFFSFSTVTAQSYLFEVPKATVELFANNDGTATLVYSYDFINQPGAHPIDYIDIGLPTKGFSLGNVSATVDGRSISRVSNADPQYIFEGQGVTLELGNLTIPAGGSGTVVATIQNITGLFYEADEPENYVSFFFSPNYFGKEYVKGNTEYAMIIYMPVGLDEDMPRYFPAEKWPGSKEPDDIGYTEGGRVFYYWWSDRADLSTDYRFGGAFPNNFIPATAIQAKPTFTERTSGSVNNFFENIFPLCCVAAFIGGPIAIGILQANQQKKRKLKYLPPKVKIEGHGIKRGLTAVQAAILLEKPMDQIVTMILFSVIRKGAAEVTKKEPLQIKVLEPLPDDLYPYEKHFLDAMQADSKKKQRTELQAMLENLITAVQEKMKGFSYKETVTYYQDIVSRAWQQVEGSETPEVAMENYDKYMGWTMLDDNYGDRTRNVFTGPRPIFVPIWWHRYDPVYRSGTSTASARPAVSGSGSRPIVGGQPSANMPTLPGADFAAGVVLGAQNFASNTIGDLTSFTERITNKTNPMPKPTYSSSTRSGGGSSGRSCACACACAGCACACAGGGR